MFCQVFWLNSSYSTKKLKKVFILFFAISDSSTQPLVVITVFVCLFCFCLINNFGMDLDFEKARWILSWQSYTSYGSRCLWPLAVPHLHAFSFHCLLYVWLELLKWHLNIIILKGAFLNVSSSAFVEWTKVNFSGLTCINSFRLIANTGLTHAAEDP